MSIKSDGIDPLRIFAFAMRIRVDHWISVGAQPSEKVATLIKKVKTNKFTKGAAPPPMTAPKPAPEPEPEAPAEEASAESSEETPSEGGE